MGETTEVPLTPEQVAWWTEINYEARNNRINRIAIYVSLIAAILTIFVAIKALRA